MNFIRISIITLGLLFFLGSAQGQNEDRFSMGPRAGVLFPKLVGDGVTTEVNTGYAFGLTSTYSILQSTGVTVDLLFTKEGAGSFGSSTLKLNYLRIPVYFDMFFNQLGEPFRPKIYAGIVPGFLIQAEIDDTEVNDNFNAFDIGAGGGVGFNYRVAKRTWLNFDVRFVRGLTNINDMANLGGKAFNQYFQGSVGLAFGM
jgi:outer membrane protein W